MQLTAIAAALTTAFAVFNGVHAGGFFSTCSGAFIESDHFLHATCGDGRGGQISSVLDLNAGIGIDPNELVCRPNGNYAANGCSGCLIRTGSFMICHCPGADKIADLNECVTNQNGLLRF